MPSIAVRNFGPIAHAEVDLKPLTVLIGSNNTGKSYLALAVYSLFQAVLRIRDHKYRPTRSRRTLKPLYEHENSVQRLVSAGGDWSRIKPDVVNVRGIPVPQSASRDQGISSKGIETMGQGVLRLHGVRVAAQFWFQHEST